MGKTKIDMLSGSIPKGILSMTIPIMIMNVMQNMFNLIDMTVLGKFADDAAVGAVGACSSIIALFTGLLIGISVGANVIVARYIGAGNKEKTEKAIGTALFFAMLGGLVLLVIGVSFAEVFLKWTNCDESLIPQAVLYFRIYFLGVPVVLLYNFSASILRAMGDTKRPMYFLLMGGVLKILLNLCGSAVFHMGSAGVALATIACNALAGGLCFTVLCKSKNGFGFSFRHFKLYGAELGDILRVGVPAGLQQALYSFANVTIVAAVNNFGPDATTGLSIANQFDGILYQISLATAYAATPYIAQNIGAGNFSRAKKAVVSAMLITIAFGASFGALSAIFSPELSSIMSSTPAVIEYSCQKMIIVSSTYFICGINEVMSGTLRGIGKAIVPTITTLIFMCLIRFPWVYFIFPLCPNLTFLYLIWPIGWVLSIITQLCVYFPSMAKLQKKHAV